MLTQETSPLKPEEYDKIPGDVLDKLKTSLDSLRNSLLAKDPLMPNHLRSSHAVLTEYPETSHLLDDQEIHDLILAAQEYTRVKIVAETVKSKGPSKAKVAGMSADDL